MLSIGELQFEWDEAKRAEIMAKRSVDILDAAQMFAHRVLTRVDTRAEYGETRRVSVGMVEDECYVVVHTERDGVIRLITAWRGGHRERQQYQAGNPQRAEGDEGAR